MLDQPDEDAWEAVVAQERPQEGSVGEPSRSADGFHSYSLEVLRLLED
jgi:hypothetical protein